MRRSKFRRLEEGSKTIENPEVATEGGEWIEGKKSVGLESKPYISEVVTKRWEKASRE